MSTDGVAEKKKALEQAVLQIEKQYGKGSIMRLGDTPQRVPAIPTGSIALDYALGIGGVPRGRVIEIFGPEASGKTTLSLQIIAEAQRLGGTVAFIDAEHALDAAYAKKLGVELESLLLSQPDTGEQALEITDTLIRSGAIDVIVIDSVAALVPKAEIEGEMGDPQMGLQARLMSQALRKLTGTISKSKCCLIFINQIRMKIGIMFGNPETTTGGNALKFYSSARLDIRRIAQIKEGDSVIGSREGELLDLGSEPLKEGDAPVIEKSGSWYTYRNDRIGQGREQARQFLRDNPVIAEDIRLKIREKLGLVKSEMIKEITKEPERPEKKEREKEVREPARARR